MKHPETAIKVAERLKRDGFDFQLKIVGYGALKEKVHSEVRLRGLSDCVLIQDAVPPDEVHKLMSQADIFLATSDYHEGWGVTINESLAEGCCVVASKSMGSVPFLINHGVNGFICDWKDVDSFYNYTKMLITDTELRESMSKEASESMKNSFSPLVAAERFVNYCNGIQYEDGLCSSAPIVRK